LTKSSRRVPLYTQIRQYVKDQIDQQIWKPGDKLPSEIELAEQFSVSRVTIKSALTALVEEGLIFRIQGKGSFVSTDSAGESIIYYPSSDTPKPQLVAFLLPNLTGSFVTKLMQETEQELVKHGFKMLYCGTHNSQEMEKKVLSEVLQLGVKGIIIFPVDGESYNEEILRLKLNQFPFVVLDRYFRGIETNSVSIDNVEGGRMAVNKLVELGHSRIGFISSKIAGTSSIEDRLAGYERGLSEHHFPVDHQLRLTNLDADKLNLVLNEGVVDEDSLQAIRSFIASRPDMTAVFALNLAIGLTTIKAVASLGLRIPEDFSIIFFDQYEMASFSAIPPTCVIQDEKAISVTAVRLLLESMQDPARSNTRITLPPKLIERNSCAAPKVREQASAH